MNNMDF